MRSLSTRATGVLIVALGVWGGLVPFVGHYFHFALGPDKAWTWTSGRLYLSVIPGAVAVLGGLILMSAGPRGSARLGALLALAAGIWFAIGPDVSLLWSANALGPAHGAKGIRVLEMVTYHTGLGALITFLAGYALPRFPVARETAEAAGAAGAGAVGAGAVAERETTRRHEPVAAREPEPVAAREPEPVSAREPEPVAAREPEPVAAREPEPIERHDQYATEPVEHQTEPAAKPASAGHEPADESPTAARSENGPAADSPAPAGSESQPATTNGQAAPPAEPQVVRRRSGGLLGALRRR